MNTYPSLLARAALAVALTTALCTPAWAQVAPAKTSDAAGSTGASRESGISPQARAVLNRMTTFLLGLRTFEITSHGTRDEVMDLGYKLQRNESSRLLVQRPNRLRAEVTGDLGDRSFFYDGSNLSMYSPGDGVYVRTPAPASLAQLTGNLLDAGIEMPLLDVLYQAADGRLTEAVRGGVLVGDATVEGIACDQLAFRQANVDWQLWVEKGARPLPRKIVVTTRYKVGDPQYQTVISWNLSPAIDASSFVFTPPKGASEVRYDAPAPLDDNTTGDKK